MVLMMLDAATSGNVSGTYVDALVHCIESGGKY
jgi:hypothetical protein